MQQRTHHCNQLRLDQVGQTVSLAGWVDSRRDHGGVIFVDLRDREGKTQIVFNPEANPAIAETAHTLRSEFVVQITGKVVARMEGTRNANIGTGDVEVVAESLTVIN